MFGVHNIPNNFFQKLEKDIQIINEAIRELEGLLVDEISVRNPDISEKEVFHDLVDKKLEAFIQSNIQRCVRLVSSISVLLERNEELSAMIIARSLLETIAFLWDFKSELHKFKEKQLEKHLQNQEEALTDFIADWAYPTRQEDLLRVKGAPEKKVPSIVGQIRNFGKEKRIVPLKSTNFCQRLLIQTIMVALTDFRFLE